MQPSDSCLTGNEVGQVCLWVCGVGECGGQGCKNVVWECVWHGRCGGKGVYVWCLFDGGSFGEGV